MNRFIQTLESRAMFSAAPLTPHVSSIVPHAPAMHVVPAAVQTLYFQGSAVGSNGKLEADLFITVSITAKGISATVLIINVNGSTSTAQLSFDSGGNFAYTNTANGTTTTLTGQLSADKKTIAASGTSTGSTGNFTVTASRVSTTPTVSSYTGSMFGAKNQSAGLNAMVVKTDSGYLGVVGPAAQGTSDGVSGMLVTFDKTGHFTGTMSKAGSVKVSATGQMTSDGKTMTGSFTDDENGVTVNGTFALRRN